METKKTNKAPLNRDPGVVESLPLAVRAVQALFLVLGAPPRQADEQVVEPC